MPVLDCDETGVTIVFKPNKVVAELGKRHVYALSADEKGKPTLSYHVSPQQVIRLLQ